MWPEQKKIGCRGVSSRPAGQQKTASSKFKTKCEELKGHRLDCGKERMLNN
jgi:hypothetical protein